MRLGGGTEWVASAAGESGRASGPAEEPGRASGPAEKSGRASGPAEEWQRRRRSGGWVGVETEAEKAV